MATNSIFCQDISFCSCFLSSKYEYVSNDQENGSFSASQVTWGAVHKVLVYRIKAPDFKGVSEYLEIHLPLKSSDYGDVQIVHCALCNSDSNWSNYESEPKSTVEDENQITGTTIYCKQYSYSDTLEYGDFSMTFITKEIEPNKYYYLFLWGYEKSSEASSDHVSFSDGTDGNRYANAFKIGYNSGLTYIDDGSEVNAYQCYIDNGESWDLLIPYIDNGITWDMYS